MDLKCLACISDEIQRAADEIVTPDIERCHDATTLAPTVQQMQVSEGVMYAVVAVPTCLNHLNVTKQAAPVSRTGLIAGR
ncbi:MAG TPA: hypothetical protein VJY65_02935 [Chloroflexota bacterium]|nr:hypothetical protein [Chloroflexota bacterium]